MIASIRVGLRLASLAALLLCACQTAGPIPEPPCSDAFSFEPRQTRRSVEFLASNECHVPVFVELSLPELQNLAPSASLPVRGSVPPHSTRVLLSLEPIDARKPWGYKWSTAVLFGSSFPDPDPDYLYAFPFGGTQPRRLIQGVGGDLTHQGLHYYAFDFVMPIGTPVLAARDGTVLAVFDGFPAGGFRKKYENRANRVVVLHADGTLALYGHLSSGVRVKEGARVEVGDLLGFSGNSGYSEGPHLHFEVDVQRPRMESQSIAIRFLGDIVPVEGRSYGPQRAAD